MADFYMVWNPTEEDVSTTIHGNFFSWKPGQLKQMRESMANFVKEARGDDGLVVIEDPRFCPATDQYIHGFDKSKEGLEILAPLREKGINNLISALLKVVRNNQISLKQDLANKYPTGDGAKMAAANASKGELEAMRLVAKYKRKNNTNEAKKVEEIESLMKDIGPFVA